MVRAPKAAPTVRFVETYGSPVTRYDAQPGAVMASDLNLLLGRR